MSCALPPLLAFSQICSILGMCRFFFFWSVWFDFCMCDCLKSKLWKGVRINLFLIEIKNIQFQRNLLGLFFLVPYFTWSCCIVLLRPSAPVRFLVGKPIEDLWLFGYFSSTTPHFLGGEILQVVFLWILGIYGVHTGWISILPDCSHQEDSNTWV